MGHAKPATEHTCCVAALLAVALTLSRPFLGLAVSFSQTSSLLLRPARIVEPPGRLSLRGLHGRNPISKVPSVCCFPAPPAVVRSAASSNQPACLDTPACAHAHQNLLPSPLNPFLTSTPSRLAALVPSADSVHLSAPLSIAISCALCAKYSVYPIDFTHIIRACPRPRPER